VDIVVQGRNVEVPDHFRTHIIDKMANVEHYDLAASRYEVVLYHEKNRRLSKKSQRVEITGRTKGATVQVGGNGPDFYIALDSALHKLKKKLRRSHDRRRIHYGRRHPISVAEATAPLTNRHYPESSAGSRN
jgi:ribosomal subunit interface protein